MLIVQSEEGPILFICRTIQAINFLKSPHLSRSDKSKWSECVGPSCREPLGEFQGGKGGNSNPIGMEAPIFCSRNTRGFKLSKKYSLFIIGQVEVV